MTENKVEQKLKKILEDVHSGDEKRISKGLKALETHGNSSVIRSLAELLLKGVSRKNEKEIIELLSSLKDSSITVEMMEVIEDESFLPIRQILLTTIWNTKVDFSDYIDEFVYIATTGTFLEALDCLTIIENLEGPFLEESILECQLHLKNYLEDDSPKEQQKAELLSEIALKVKEINMQLMD